MVAPNYTARRSAFAKNIGFGLREKPVAAVPASAGESETVSGTIEAIAAEPASVAKTQSQDQAQGGRGPAGGPGETQARSPAQGDDVSELIGNSLGQSRFVPAPSSFRTANPSGPSRLFDHDRDDADRITAVRHSLGAFAHREGVR